MYYCQHEDDQGVVLYLIYCSCPSVLNDKVYQTHHVHTFQIKQGNHLLPNTTFEQAIETEVDHLIQRGLLREGTLSLSEYEQRRDEFDLNTVGKSHSPILIHHDLTLEEYTKVAGNVLLINETVDGTKYDEEGVIVRPHYFPHLLFRGIYALQLLPWVKKFGQDERMMILKFEDFAGDDANQTEVEEKILLFAGLTNPVLKERKRQVKANGFTKSEMNPITKEYLTWLYQPFNDLLPTLLGEEWRGVWDEEYNAQTDELPEQNIDTIIRKEGSGIPHLNEMQSNRNLSLSYRHQRKFFSVKDDVISYVLKNKNMTHYFHGDDKGGHLFAFRLNNDYAFRHIFKNGGTTIARQTGVRNHGHVPRKKIEIGNRRLVTVVRDPIDHFLSGWSECGFREALQDQRETDNTTTYDERIQSWLKVVEGRRKPVGCRPHSYPQANFLLDTDGSNTYESLDLIGDLNELPQVLGLAGFEYNYSIPIERNSSENEVKEKLYPKRVDLISDDTMKQLCRYLALDYYLFDFTPPMVCREDTTVLPLLNMFKLQDESSEEVPSSETNDFDTGRNITKADLPIYLLQPDTDQTVQIKWEKLAQMWNRTIQYEDIVQHSTPISSLPPLPSSNLRRVVMLHTSPKMGSSTIREACSVNYEKTCGIPYKAVNMKPYHGQSINRPPRPIPLGYQDGKTLYPMMRKCRNTSHFCVKDIILPTGIPTYDDVMFVHMFPFRNYNEFAKSALKQRYDVDGNSGCSRVKSLLGECKPGRYELDLRQYSKTQLSRFKEEVVQRMNDRNEHHIFLLYHHGELDSVLDKLSGVYNIPRLPGSNGTRNEVRPKGTCEDSKKLLDMYHDCFSDELMELT